MVVLRHRLTLERRSPIVLGLALAVALGGGCHRQGGPPPPPTFPVIGVVRYPDGRPLGGGIIQFLSERDQRLNMSSAIRDDGSFQLTTSFGNRNLAGAIEGSCQVLVTLPIVAGKLPRILLLHKRYNVRPEGNRLVVDLEDEMR